MRWYPLRPAVLWAMVILFLCLLPGPAIPTWEWANMINLDKAVHVTLFAVLFVLTAHGLQQQYDHTGLRSNAVWAAFVATVAYGGLTELMQQIPVLGRRGDVLDLLANTAGGVIGLAYFRWKGGSMIRSWKEKES